MIKHDVDKNSEYYVNERTLHKFFASDQLYRLEMMSQLFNSTNYNTMLGDIRNAQNCIKTKFGSNEPFIQNVVLTIPRPILKIFPNASPETI